MISCKKPVGIYAMTWGIGDYGAFEKAASALVPKDIVRARCEVMPIQDSPQIEIQCLPPVKVKQ
jgi:hypothetical protein